MKILNRAVMSIIIVMVFSWANIGYAGLAFSPIRDDRPKTRNDASKGHQNLTIMGDLGSITDTQSHY